VAGETSLQLRVSATGLKTWRLRSRKTGALTLGRYPDVSLAEAKRAATLLIAQAEREAVNAKAGHRVLAVKETRTLGDILDAYATAKGAAVSSWPDQRRAILLRYNPKHKAKALTETKMVMPVARQRTIAAKRSCRYLSTVLRWAKVGEPIDNAVLDSLVPEKARQRILTDDEMLTVWDATGQLDPAWRDFVRVLMLTMARRKDAAEAVAGDFQGDVWHRVVFKAQGTR
jgi:integrase